MFFCFLTMLLRFLFVKKQQYGNMFLKGERMKVYNKLVRDKIPEIIESRGATCQTRILSDEEYLIELNKKLQEEVSEYLESGEVEELSDIAEVMISILEVKNVGYKDFENIRIQKAQKRGAFKSKIFLESVKED